MGLLAVGRQPHSRSSPLQSELPLDLDESTSPTSPSMYRGEVKVAIKLDAPLMERSRRPHGELVVRVKEARGLVPAGRATAANIDTFCKW